VELTPEEKLKIYVEEKERVAAREQLRTEEKKKAGEARAIGCAVVTALGLAVALLINLGGRSTETGVNPQPPSNRSIAANEPASNPGSVEGTAANVFLAKQAEKNRQLMDVIRTAKDSGNNVSSAVRALRIRRAELGRAQRQIENGDFSIADKTIMQDTVSQEAQWVNSSIQLLSSVE
jgi:hypothetical protein